MMMLVTLAAQEWSAPEVPPHDPRANGNGGGAMTFTGGDPEAAP